MSQDSFLAGAFAAAVHQQMPDTCPTMLEVGCGRGYAAQFMRVWASKLTLVDISAVAVAAASRRFAGDSCVDCFCADSAHLQGQFEVIYYFLSLHHIADVAAELEQVRRLLSPKGSLFIAEYIPVGAQPFHRYDAVPHDGFTLPQLQALLREAHLKVTATQPLPLLTSYAYEPPLQFPLYVMSAVPVGSSVADWK